MPFHLDHTIVPARNKEESARWFARMFGLEYKGLWGHFAPVRVDDNLSLDFDDAGENLPCLHFAFITTDAEFDTVLQRVKDEGIAYGAVRAISRTMRSTTTTRAAGSTSVIPTGTFSR